MNTTRDAIKSAMVWSLSTLAILLVFSAAPASADVNIFGIDNITIDPTYTSPVIAPFTAPCPPYPSCTMDNPQVWPQGFPVQNIFGAGILTAEGGDDTIFAGAGSGYENVFFHLNDLQPLTGTVDITVTGAQDGPTNPFRSFSYFDLYSYSGNVNAPDYQLLFSGTPVVTNGLEVVTGAVHLTDASPYLIYQFGAPDGGPRIFGVTATLTPEPGFYGMLALGLSGLGLVLPSRKRNRTAANT
jgi:hypothetical protein